MAHSILHIPAVSVCLVLQSLLGVQKVLMHKLLDLLHLLDLLNDSSTALNPIQNITVILIGVPYTICAGDSFVLS